MASKVSRLDTVYRSLLLTRFFTKGWGHPDHLKEIFKLRRQLARRDVALSYVDPNHPVTITSREIKNDCEILEGHFISPFAQHLPKLLPPESIKAHFQVVLPTKCTTGYRPICIQYAGTGDHFFWRRRRLMAMPLLKERGIASIILENPFYGLRKPKQQLRSSLQQVSDLFVMGACLILESLVLFHWCERHGYWPLISHGISMGGHMASLGATVWPKPIVLVPCLSWTSASVTFTKGVMTGAIPWHLMEHQFATTNSYREELAHMIQCEENAFQAGVEFAKHFESISEHKFKESTGKVDSSVLRPSIFDSLQLPYFSQQSAFKESISILSKLKKLGNHEKYNSIRREAFQFMGGIMDECTHLRNYDVPFDPSLIVIVIAENDAYQPREGVASLPDIWPGASLRIIEDKGHVTSYLFKQDFFRQAIYDALDKLIAKYPNPYLS